MIDALQQSHTKLSKRVRDMELERAKHLTMIDTLKEFVPQHMLQQFTSTFSSCGSSATHNGGDNFTN